MDTFNKILEEEREDILEWFEEQEEEHVLGSTIQIRTFQWKLHTISFEGDFRHRVNSEERLFETLREALDHVITLIKKDYGVK